jgi:hypothetical protein
MKSREEFYKLVDVLTKDEKNQMFHYLVGFFADNEEFQDAVLTKYVQMRCMIDIPNKKEHDEFLKEEIEFDLRQEMSPVEDYEYENC